MEDEQKEKYISTSPEPLSIEGTKTILKQMKKCVCKIYNGEKGAGTGFFIKIPYKSNLLPTLITAYHVINEKDKNKHIMIALNDDKEKKLLKIDNKRKMYTNEKLDVTIIEIKEIDDISNYLELDDDTKNNIKLENEEISNLLNNIYSIKSIYSISYPKGKNVSVSYAQSPQLLEKKLNHKCSTLDGSSGAPILLIENQKVIGIHLSASKKNFNIGILIIYSIIEFQQIENNNSNNSPSIAPNNLNNINQNQIIINNRNQKESKNNYNQNQGLNNYIYLFPKIGLNNIGSTFYMNATLQCLLHVSELTVYFLREYPNDKKNLNEKNKLIESHGQISNVFYELVKGVCEDEYKIKKNLNYSKQQNSMNDNSNYSGSHKNFEKVEPNLSNSNTVMSRSSSFSPYNFKKTLGIYNPQFKKFEYNDFKDLILYLMKAMHDELNYFGGNNSINLSRPNQYDKVNTFMYFMNSYNFQNFSIISNIFYGTYENATTCHECNKLLYNYQKFEFISFGMSDYSNKEFDIYNGFKDNSKPLQLRGENQLYCNTCKKLVDAEITSKIIQPPKKLLIYIDYGKNKAFRPSQVKFDEIIDITNYVCFDFGYPIKYKIIGVCTRLGPSGSYGHYIAYCKHRETGDWFNFNDSTCRKCNKDEIYGGSPYLLLYEKI